MNDKDNSQQNKSAQNNAQHPALSSRIETVLPYDKPVEREVFVQQTVKPSDIKAANTSAQKKGKEPKASKSKLENTPAPSSSQQNAVRQTDQVGSVAPPQAKFERSNQSLSSQAATNSQQTQPPQQTQFYQQTPPQGPPKPPQSPQPQESSQPPQPPQKPKNYKRRIILITGLCFLVALSAFLVGLFIGETNKEDQIGTIIDLTDGEKVNILISGRILDDADNPCAGVVLRINSEPQLVITDTNGCFSFHSVPFEEHTISVLNSRGEVVCQSVLNVLSYGLDTTTQIGFAATSDGYDMSVSPDVKLVDVVLRYDDTSGDESIDFLVGQTEIVTAGGNLTNTDGTLSAGTSAIITASGAVVLSDNTIVLNSGVISLSDGTLMFSLTEPLSTSSGATINVDSSIILADGTIINGNSAIVFTDTSTTTHEKGESVIISDGALLPASSGETIAPASGLGSALVDLSTWTGTINLFGTPEGEEPVTIKPGSSGSYTIKLENNNTFNMSVKIYINEEAHSVGKIPLQYRIRIGNQYVGGSDEWLSETELSQAVSAIASGASINYTIEWRWELNGNDQLDTALATAADRLHVIIVRIYGEQVND